MIDSFDLKDLKALIISPEWPAFLRLLNTREQELTVTMKHDENANLKKIQTQIQEVTYIRNLCDKTIKDSEYDAKQKGGMMKLNSIKTAVLVLALCLFSVKVHAFSKPNFSKGLSDVSSNVNVSTFVNSRGPLPNGTETLVSSGVVSGDYISISSPGINSRILIYDSTFTTRALLANQPLLDAAQSNTANLRIPLENETVSGLVAVSTCAACLLTWSEPDWKATYIRKR